MERAQIDKISHFEPFMSSECDSGAKKLMEFQNNVRNVLRDIKLPLENIMKHLGWQNVVTLEKN